MYHYDYMTELDETMTDDDVVSTAVENLKECLKHELGMTEVPTCKVNDGDFHIARIGCSVSVFCTLNDAPVVDDIIDMFTGDEFAMTYGFSRVDGRIVRMQIPQRKWEAKRARGRGFGVNKWRYNRKLKGVEFSFGGKPDDHIITLLKGKKCRWNNSEGIWYGAMSKLIEDDINDIVQVAGLSKVEDVK